MTTDVKNVSKIEHKGILWPLCAESTNGKENIFKGMIYKKFPGMQK